MFEKRIEEKNHYTLKNSFLDQVIAKFAES